MNIWRINQSRGGIESHQPVLSQLRHWHGELDRFLMRIEEQQEMVISYWSADGVELRDSVPVEKDHQAAGESGVPIGLVHL